MRAVHPSQSSSAMPSSMLMMGYCVTHSSYMSISFVRGEYAAILDEDVGVLVAKLAGRYVQRDAALLARTVPRRLNGLDHEVDRSEIGYAAGSGAPLVSDRRSESTVSQQST